METPTKSKAGGEPATGVSRSGRVRKKSSKLADFESPDEIDNRFKRKTERSPHKSPKVKVGQPVGSDVYDDSDGYGEDDIDIKDEPLEVEEDWGENDEGEEDLDDGDEGDEGPDPLHVDEDSTDMPREITNYNQAQSLYFSEKQGKKNLVIKDGQVVRRKKAQRKDKGMSEDMLEEGESETEEAPQKSPIAKLKPPNKVRKRPAENEDPRIHHALSIMENVNKQVQSKKQDDYDIFGIAVATKLRRIKDEHTRILVQRDIDMLLYDAILGTGKYSTTPVPSPYSENSTSNQAYGYSSTVGAFNTFNYDGGNNSASY